MKRKIPPDSFDYYVALGLGRSYQAVAKHYGVSKVAVTNRATKEGWQKKLAEMEAKVRRASEQKALETLDDIHQRHLKAARVIQAKALEALSRMPLDSAMDAVRALDLGVRQERLLIGQPTDRSAVSIEEVIKNEYAKVMRPLDADEWKSETRAEEVSGGSAA